MGSFPHEFPGYRHVSDRLRASFETDWGVALDAEPGFRIPNMFEAALDGSFKGLVLSRAKTLPSPTRIRNMSRRRSQSMECVVVQDLFLNETAKYAHVFLPGSSFLEKDGTFTNAERRISPVRKVMEPLAGMKTGK